MRLWLALLLVLLAAAPALSAPDLEALSRQVEEVRGLRFLEPVPSRAMSLEQAAAYVRGLLGEEMAAPSTEVRERFLIRLGLLPPGSRLENLLGDLYAEQVRGLYDPHRKVFLLVTGAPTDQAIEQALPLLGLDLQTLYAVHELEHALQDQHFRLLDLDRSTADDFDRALAAHSLVEGDANLVMYEAAAARMGIDPEVMVDVLSQGLGNLGGLEALAGMPEFGRSPRFLQQLVTVPYFQGLAFTAALRARGGWPEVDGAFRRLPPSTEQVLHPEKYLQGVDPPRTVRLPSLDLPGWKVLGDDTAGEFTVKVWGEELLGKEEGPGAAAGWGGDRYRVYRRGDSDLVVWGTVWDSEADAREFETLAQGAVGGMAGASEGFVERRGDRVLVVLGPVEAGTVREVWSASWEP